MKIANLNTGFNGNNQYGKSVRGSEPMPNHTPGFRKASGGEDFLEISDEAVKRHKEAKILNFEESRRKKEAKETAAFTENMNLTDRAKTGRIKDMIADDKYNFNDPEILGETAERVIGLFR